MVFDIPSNEIEGRTATGCGEIGRRPEDALPVPSGNFGAHPSQAAAGHALQAVDQPGERHLGRIVDKQVDMVVLAVAFDQFVLEVVTDLREDVPQVLHGRPEQHAAPVHRDEDQMDVKREDAMPARPRANGFPPLFPSLA